MMSRQGVPVLDGIADAHLMELLALAARLPLSKGQKLAVQAEPASLRRLRPLRNTQVGKVR
jgi:hypothetical protein